MSDKITQSKYRRMNAIIEQAANSILASELAPAPGSPSGIEAEVCADIAARQKKGIQKYACTVAENPMSLLNWMQAAYEECLDQAIYLKRAMREMENK